MMNKKLKRLACYNMLFVLLILHCGCDNTMRDAGKKISLKLFDVIIDTLSGDHIVASEQADGYSGMVLINSIDTVSFHFGYDVDNLAEHDKAIFVVPGITDTINIDTAAIDSRNVIFTNKPSIDIDEFRKQNVYFDTISGLHAKITFPRRIEKGGFTGVYVDSLVTFEGGRLKFNFYASDLDSIMQERMLRAIRSIKFKLH